MSIDSKIRAAIRVFVIGLFVKYDEYVSDARMMHVKTPLQQDIANAKSEEVLEQFIILRAYLKDVGEDGLSDYIFEGVVRRMPALKMVMERMGPVGINTLCAEKLDADGKVSS